MKELLAKIKEAAERKDAQTKCALVAQMYEQMNAKLEKVDSDLDIDGLHMDNGLGAADQELDVADFDGQLDELESISNELVRILNLELQKVLKFLKPRFETHMYRHPEITWEQVEQRLREADTKKIWSLSQMEKTGGEPDVTGFDEKTGELIFQDRSPESPIGRRNCCYDKDGENKAKKEGKSPISNAVDMASRMGVEILDQQAYIEAQEVDVLDDQSWSWLKTPPDIRKNDTALTGFRRQDRGRTGEDDPDDHKDVRGFRASLTI